MTRRRLVLGLTLAALLGVASLSASLAASPRNFHAHLSGGNEIPANDSKGTGQAKFKLNKAGDALSYKLIVANVDDVTQAHIHCGGADVNGPVVAFLFGFVDGGVTQNGVLAEGVIEADDIIAQFDSAACPGGVADFDDLITKITSGEAYVNVHTVAIPGGEVRGQIR